MGETIDGMTDEEWTSRAHAKANLLGFTLWHCARSIDWAVSTVGAGITETAERPEWRDVKPARVHFGEVTAQLEAIRVTATT